MASPSSRLPLQRPTLRAQDDTGTPVEALTTQMYVAGEPGNARDRLYRRLGERAPLVTVAFETSGGASGQQASFDIVLAADGRFAAD